MIWNCIHIFNCSTLYGVEEGSGRCGIALTFAEIPIPFEQVILKELSFLKNEKLQTLPHGTVSISTL